MSGERRRRNQDVKKENNERWVISYADFMTLLLATFVVLYAVSSINVSRYRAAAEALSAVFTGKVIVPNKGEGANPSGMFQNQPAPVPKPIMKPDTPTKGVPNVSEKIRERIAKLNQAYKNLSHLLQDVIDKGQVHIAHNGLSVVIDINATLLFDSGKAELTTSALGVIDQIGIVLKDQPYSIQVNGYTDNAPIHTAQFSSNWELSAMRAISVVRRFVSDGVDPTLLVGAGYGEYHPLADNDTPENKGKNRRVQIVVVSADDAESAAASAKPGAAGTAPTNSTMSDRAGVPHALPAKADNQSIPLATPSDVKALTAPRPSAASTPSAMPLVAAKPAMSAAPTPVSVPSSAASSPPAAPVANRNLGPFAPGQPH